MATKSEDTTRKPLEVYQIQVALWPPENGKQSDTPWNVSLSWKDHSQKEWSRLTSIGTAAIGIPASISTCTNVLREFLRERGAL